MPSILLVEDVAVVRMVLRRILQRSGHDVTEATDGEDALAKLKTQAFDAMITDIWMPRLDGISLISQARAVQPGLKVIAVSGGAPRAPQEFSIRGAREAGADDALLKPVDKDELLKAIDFLLSPTELPDPTAPFAPE